MAEFKATPTTDTLRGFVAPDLRSEEWAQLQNTITTRAALITKVYRDLALWHPDAKDQQITTYVTQGLQELGRADPEVIPHSFLDMEWLTLPRLIGSYNAVSERFDHPAIDTSDVLQPLEADTSFRTNAMGGLAFRGMISAVKRVDGHPDEIGLHRTIIKPDDPSWLPCKYAVTQYNALHGATGARASQLGATAYLLLSSLRREEGKPVLDAGETFTYFADRRHPATDALLTIRAPYGHVKMSEVDATDSSGGFRLAATAYPAP